MKDSLNIAIAGATGYVGLELIKILSNHPKATIVYLCARKSIGKSINVFDKRIKKKNLPKISKIKKINWNKVNILFTANFKISSGFLFINKEGVVVLRPPG